MSDSESVHQPTGFEVVLAPKLPVRPIVVDQVMDSESTARDPFPGNGDRVLRRTPWRRPDRAESATARHDSTVDGHGGPARSCSPAVSPREGRSAARHRSAIMLRHGPLRTVPARGDRPGPAGGRGRQVRRSPPLRDPAGFRPRREGRRAIRRTSAVTGGHGVAGLRHRLPVAVHRLDRLRARPAGGRAAPAGRRSSCRRASSPRGSSRSCRTGSRRRTCDSNRKR